MHEYTSVEEALTPDPPAKDVGRKFDGGKPRWCLLPFKQVEQVVMVLTDGAVKYADDNWKNVRSMRTRYFSAAMRHITAWWEGERCDPETGRSHLAHAICCILFLMWADDNNIEPITERTETNEEVRKTV